MSKTKILVCCHKACDVPNDDVYLPIHCGAALGSEKLDMQRDDTGDNISIKNTSYCELTGLYWAWKNLKDVDYIGLCHYRRYFALDKNISGQDGIYRNHIPNMKNYNNLITKYLKRYSIIMPTQKIYKYSLKVDYCVCHYSEDYKTIKQIVHELYPEYDSSVTTVMEYNNKLSPYNMFITSFEIFKSYCEWLFPIVFEAERRINISDYNDYQKRVFAFFAERLFNVYIKHHNIKTKYKPIYWIIDKPQTYYIFDYLRNIRDMLAYMMQKPIRKH